MQQLVLASTSPFRKQLLEKLRLEFITDSPDIDESRREGETPEQLVARLAEQKAMAVAERHKEDLIIGSDQVAVIDGDILGKPGNHEKAVAQLKAATGRRITFLTGLCLYNSATGDSQVEVVPFGVVFRELSECKSRTT